MSCNGCRVLRKGCSESCVLRTCLRWIDSPESQGYATLFLAKFFGRSDLLSFVSAVPENQRPALFRSLLFEACGRTVNPVSGAVGLLSSGNWHVCNAAVQTVLSGGVLRPLPSAGVDQLTSRGGGAVQNNNNNNNNNNNLYYASVPSAHEGRSVQQPLDVGLSLAAAAGGRSGRGRSSCAVANKRMRDTVSLDSEESVMTTSFQRGGSGGGDSNGDGSKLLKLFF